MVSKQSSDIIFDSFLYTMAKYYGELDEQVGFYTDLSRFCYNDTPKGLDFFRRQGWPNSLNQHQLPGPPIGVAAFWHSKVNMTSSDEDLLAFFEYKLAVRYGRVSKAYKEELFSGQRPVGQLCRSQRFSLEEYEELLGVEDSLYDDYNLHWMETEFPPGSDEGTELLKHRLRWFQQCIHFSSLTVRFPSPKRVSDEFANGRNFRTMTLCVSFDKLEGNKIRYHNPNLLSPFLRNGAGGVRIRPDGNKMMCSTQYLDALGVSDETIDRDYASWCSVCDTLTYLVHAKTIEDLIFLDAHMEIDSPQNIINVVVVLNLWSGPENENGAVETHFTWSIRDVPGECSRSATSNAGLCTSLHDHVIEDDEVQPDYANTSHFHRAIGRRGARIGHLPNKLQELCHTSALYSCFRPQEIWREVDSLSLVQRNLLEEARLSTEGKSLQYVLPLLASVGTLAFAECNARPPRRSQMHRCSYPDEVWTEAYYICDTCQVNQVGLGTHLARKDDPEFTQDVYLRESPLNAIFRARTATSVAASTLLSIQVLRKVRTVDFH